MTALATPPRVVVTARDRCRACAAPRVEEFLCLPDMPLTEGFIRADDVAAEFLAPIRVFRCAACGLCQTQHDVNVADYYEQYAYSSAASRFTQRFMDTLAETLATRYDLSPGDVVAEIGSGDGTQLACFARRGLRVIGFEPSRVLAAAAENRDVPSIVGLFDARTAAQLPAALRPVAAALLLYTLDHLPDPVAALTTLRGLLDPRRGIVVIEIHDLDTILARREFCLFEHEHTIYCSAATLEALLRRAGFALLDLDLLPLSARRANSLLAVATPLGSALAPSADRPDADPSPSFTLESLHAAAGAIHASTKRLQRYLADARRTGRSIAGYGAGGRGVMTLAACARPGDIAYLCDENPRFHGWLTPCSRVPVVAPSHVAHHPVDELIVFSFGYLPEVRTRMAEFRYSGILTPLPALL